MKFKILTISSILAVSLFSAKAFAATVSFTADKQSVNVGDTISVVFTTNTQAASINAAQGIVHFSPSVLQLVSTDRINSVFSLWVEDPNISNTVGTMSFTGGTTSGISGSALNILSMTFKASGVGTSSITFTDGAVTANDGLGTNLLTSVNRAVITVSGPATPAVAPVSPVSPVIVAPVIVPQPVVRVPVPTGKLPILPTIEVSGYPDETRWYGKIVDVSVFWNIPKGLIS